MIFLLLGKRCELYDYLVHMSYFNYKSVLIWSSFMHIANVPYVHCQCVMRIEMFSRNTQIFGNECEILAMNMLTIANQHETLLMSIWDTGNEVLHSNIYCINDSTIIHKPLLINRKYLPRTSFLNDYILKLDCATKLPVVNSINWTGI